VINRGRITIGSNCALNDGVLIDPGEKLVIGNNVVISPHAMILGSDLAPKVPTKHYAGTIIVEDDVWIGAGSIILKNTRIGKGAVVGAGSVVTGDVPPQAVVAGNPACVIKKRSSG
jgi:acetyltransferase-like isoleucine patch superfamily enzyme